MPFQIAEAFIDLTVRNSTFAGLREASGNLRSAVYNMQMSVAGFMGNAVSNEMMETIRATRQYESSVWRLASAMREAGTFSKASMDDLNQFATGLSAISTFSDEQVREAMAVIAAKTGLVGDQLKMATKAALGLSKAFDVDVTSASRIVTLAVAGHTDQLGRYGYVIDSTMSSQQALNMVLEKGLSSFDNYSTEIEQIDGQLKQLGNTIDDIRAKSVEGVLGPTDKRGTAETLRDMSLGWKKYYDDLWKPSQPGQEPSWFSVGSQLPQAVLDTVFGGMDLPNPLGPGVVHTDQSGHLGAQGRWERSKAAAATRIGNSPDEIKVKEDLRAKKAAEDLAKEWDKLDKAAAKYMEERHRRDASYAREFMREYYDRMHAREQYERLTEQQALRGRSGGIFTAELTARRLATGSSYASRSAAEEYSAEAAAQGRLASIEQERSSTIDGLQRRYDALLRSIRPDDWQRIADIEVARRKELRATNWEFERRLRLETEVTRMETRRRQVARAFEHLRVNDRGYFGVLGDSGPARSLRDNINVRNDPTLEENRKHTQILQKIEHNTRGGRRLFE